VSAQVGPEDTKKRVVLQSKNTMAAPAHQFTWYYPNWEPHIDENGQTYYQNALSLETRWDPRELEDIEESEVNDYYNSDQTWDSPHMEDYNTDENTRQASMIRTASSMAFVQKQKAAQIEERQEKVKEDPIAPWADLSEKAKINMDTLQEHVAEAQGIVKEVAAGKCTPELLYQLPWAYKVQQLHEAVQDCYLNMGDIYDSSKYDNCNGVPRYEDGGLVSWWEELEDMHMLVTSVIESGQVGQESEKYMNEMKKLQGIAAMGNEDELIEGFLARKIEVDNELEDLRARCFAAVCVEGGPKRESLDQLYMYLKDNVNGETNLEDLQDEMEEVVSTALEQKHRFMVDVVLFMGILEDEHVRLETRINNFTGERWRGGGGANRQGSGDEDVEDEDDEEADEEEMDEDMGEVDQQGVVRRKVAAGGAGAKVAEDGTIIAGGDSSEVLLSDEVQFDVSTLTAEEQEAYANMSPDDKAVLRQKMAEQAQESQKLADELQHQKDKRSQALKDRLAKKKQARMAELQSEGLSEDEAAAKADEEVAVEETAEITKIDEEIAEELQKDQTKKLSAALSLYTDKDKDKDVLKAKMAEQEAESKRLSDELQHQKDKRAQALKDRLAKKKGARLTELKAEGLSEDEAALKADIEASVEEEEEINKIDEEIIDSLKSAELEKAQKLGDVCDEEAKRIAEEIEAERTAKLAELDAELEAERAKLLASGMSTEEVDAAIDTKHDMMEHEIEKELCEKAEKRRLAIVQSIRDEHLKSSTTLKNELDFQKEQKAKALKERLNQKKQARTAQLMKEGQDVEIAVAMATAEVDGELEEETKKLDKEFQSKQKEAEERALKAIKDAQEKEAMRLEQDMIHQESRQKKNLQDRLRKREKKREETLQAEGVSVEEAHKIAEEEKLREEAKQTELLEKEIAEIKRVQEEEAQKLSDIKAAKKDNSKKALQERLAKKKAKKQQEITPEQLTENYLKIVRADQKESMNKLLLFIDEEKKKAVAQAEAHHDSDALSVAMLFTAVKESMVTGYKKQCVYQVRALKDKLATEPLSAEEHAKAMSLASENLISRHNKDMKSIIDTQLSEQNKVKAKLTEDGAPMIKMLEMEEKFHKRNVDLVRKQSTKLYFTLAAIYLDMSHLLENHHDGADDHHDEDDEDEDDIFGDKASKHVFSAEAQDWFKGAMGLQSAYDKVPVALLTTFQEILLDIQSGTSSIPIAEGGIAGQVFYNLTLVLLQIVGHGFEKSVSVFDRVAQFSAANESVVSSQLTGMATNHSAAQDAAFVVMDKQVGFAMQTPFKDALKCFLAKPMTEKSEFSKKIEAIKIQTAEAAEKAAKSSQGVVENIDRSNRILKTLEGKVDKRKREIVEKYRKIKESKERECKEAGTEVPPTFASGQDLACEEEVSKLKLAFSDIRDEVTENTDKLQMVNADGLMFAVERRLKGEKVVAKDFKTIQDEVEKENEKLEAKKLLQAQQDEAEKLDVMLKVQKAREQQALQKRLLERKKKKKATQQ